MEFNIEKIFLPSVGVDLVFDMDNASSIARASIIYDTDHETKTITIAQPTVPLTPSTKFRQLHLTTIVQIKQRRTRVGISCRPVKFIEKYPLANKALTKALVLEYTPHIAETNIRSAFRLALSTRHTAKGKIMYNKRDFFTVKDFRIKDLSFTGIGLVVPKRQKNRELMGLTKGKLLTMGLSLIDRELDSPLGTFPIKARVVRINPNYSETHTLIGLRIEAITPDNEEILIKFIHEAQIAELKRLSQKG